MVNRRNTAKSAFNGHGDDEVTNPTSPHYTRHSSRSLRHTQSLRNGVHKDCGEDDSNPVKHESYALPTRHSYRTRRGNCNIVNGASDNINPNDNSKHSSSHGSQTLHSKDTFQRDHKSVSPEDRDEREDAGSTRKVCTRWSLRSTAQIENNKQYKDDTLRQDCESDQYRRSLRRRQLQSQPYKEHDLGDIYGNREGSNNTSTAKEGDDIDDMDMYTRVKRVRRKVKRDMYGMPLVEEEEKTTEDEETEEDDEEDGDENEEEDEEEEETATVQYNLRRNKPRTKLYEATIERKTRDRYSIDTPPKRKYKQMAEIQFKSPAHRRHKRKKVHHRSSSTSSSGSESDDERRFARRKNKSMAKARQRCLPMNLSQTDLSHTMKDRQKIGASLADIDPMSIDRTVTFDSVGGLREHLQALKEMVVFPLLYPEVFDKFKIAPPRGVLFHGPPGTGKTLVARALANECSIGEKRVAFFMRKGADCLSKWVGESERQLRLLFDQAYQVRPSIIFFDEIDGLAPVRSSRQDQIHSSIVSTLLALMDGLDSRGEVVVIGATNRIDSIDPALRRPGRFDREFLFSLPSVEARADILRIHTKEWNPKLLDKFISEVASKCNGYCGADMKALCTEAALHALRRRYPQIYTSSDKLQLDVTSININAADFHYAMTKIVPAGQRAISSPSRPLSTIIKPLLHAQLEIIITKLGFTFPYINKTTIPCTASPTDRLLELLEDNHSLACVTECSKSTRKSKQGADTGPFLDFSITAHSRPIMGRPRLLLYGNPNLAHSTHLAPALLDCMEKVEVHILDVPTLYCNSAKSPEEACSQVFREARRATPSVIYIPHIDKWWSVLSDTMQATFLMLLDDLDPLLSILLLATADMSSAHSLQPEVRRLFLHHESEVYPIRSPSETEIRLFFEDLIMRQTCIPPTTGRQAAHNMLEVLPKVPVPKQVALTDAEEKTLWEEEENVLRELRLFLRDMLNKLARDRKFNIFSKPVDIEEVPDYHDIIKTPMDLFTMMSKIDLHKYQACVEFLDDIDLICANALEYNPADSSAGRAIRHRACALKDMAHALISAELDEDFEKQCLDIRESRKNRGKSPSKSAPKYYHTKPVCTGREGDALATGPTPSRYSRRLRREQVTENDSMPTRQLSRLSHDITEDDVAIRSNKKKKKKRSRWSQGLPSAPKRRRASPGNNQEDEDEEDEGERDGTQVECQSENKELAQESVVEDVTHVKQDLNDVFGEDTNSTTATRDATSNNARVSPMTANTSVMAHETSLLGADGSLIASDTNSKSSLNGTGCMVEVHTAANGLQSSANSCETTTHQPDASGGEPVVDDNMEEGDGERTGESVEGEGPIDEDALEHSPETHLDGHTSSMETTDVLPQQVEPSQAEMLAVTPTSPPLAKETIVELHEPEVVHETKRMTRSMATDTHMKCTNMVEEATPEFTIDKTRLPALLDKAVAVGLLCNISELEKLYSLLAQRIYVHRNSYDRAALLKDLEDVLNGFAEAR